MYKNTVTSHTAKPRQHAARHRTLPGDHERKREYQGFYTKKFAFYKRFYREVNKLQLSAPT